MRWEFLINFNSVCFHFRYISIWDTNLPFKQNNKVSYMFLQNADFSLQFPFKWYDYHPESVCEIPPCEAYWLFSQDI